MTLSKEQFEELDNFILNHNPTNKWKPIMSYNDMVNGKEIYLNLKEKEGQYYEICGTDGGGYTCYALYKSKVGIIYLFTISIQTLTSYFIVDDNYFNNVIVSYSP